MSPPVLTAIITGCFTLLGVIAGIILEFYIHEKRVRERFFKALYDEIQLNLLIVRETLDALKVTSTAYTPIYTHSYGDIRASGYLIDLNRELRVKLWKAFDQIYRYDRDGKYEYWHRDLLKDLVKDLEYLEKELPSHLKFLN